MKKPIRLLQPQEIETICNRYKTCDKCPLNHLQNCTFKIASRNEDLDREVELWIGLKNGLNYKQ